MVRIGDRFKDLEAYLSYRISILEIEKRRMPKNIENPKRRHPTVKQINGRILELLKVKAVISGNIKAASKRAYKSLDMVRRG